MVDVPYGLCNHDTGYGVSTGKQKPCRELINSSTEYGVTALTCGLHGTAEVLDRKIRKQQQIPRGRSKRRDGRLNHLTRKHGVSRRETTYNVV